MLEIGLENAIRLSRRDTFLALANVGWHSPRT
jgi:hypothetical protein